MKKWLFLSAVAAALGAGGWFYVKNPTTPKTPVPTQNRPSTAAVELRSIHFALNSAGDIGPADQVSVRPEINGKISDLPVDIGDTVKKGALLFALDDTDLQTDRSARLTDIAGTKLTVEKTQRDYERARQLFADQLISQEVYDDTKTEFQIATNTLEKAEKALRTVEDQLSKTRIVAPFDCTVLTRPVSIGQAVSGSAGFNSGTEVLTIANLNEMIVSAHVNQADVAHMSPGQEVDIEVEAVSGLKFKGTVERIAPQATIKNNLKGFDARILLKDLDGRARPGMTANLSIPVASADNVLSVPLAAVFTEQDERYVYVKKEDESYEVRLVDIGVSDYQYAQVKNGLAAGEIVSLVKPADAPEPKPPAAKPGKPAKRAENLAGKPGGGATNGSAGAKRTVL